MADSEFESTLRVASTPLRFLMLAARDTALRSGTIYRLTPQNVVDNVIRAETKNGAAIVVPVTGRLLPLMQVALQQAQTPTQPLLHALGVSPTQFTTSLVTRWLKKAQRKAGSSEWGWHDLRRTAVQRLYEKTHDLHLCSSLLGHKNLHATLTYLGAQRKPLSPEQVAIFASVAPGETP